MQKLILYSTAGCHLCERALDEVESCMSDYEFTVTEVDIAVDRKLLQAYGTSIPVLFFPQSGASLFWPFDRLQVIELLN